MAMGTLRAGVGVQRADHPSFWERWEPQVQRTIGGYDLRLWGSKAGRHVTLASGGDGAALHIYCPLPQACSPSSKWPGHFLWPVKRQVSLPGKSFRSSPGLVLSCPTRPAGELCQSSWGAESALDGSRACKAHSFTSNHMACGISSRPGMNG